MANKYDVKAVLFHVGERGKTSNKAINFDSFVQVINSPVIKERLEDGKLLGLLTHDGRSRARSNEIPHHDAVMRDPDLCNILRQITVKDNTVYGYMDLTDTDAATRFRNLMKMGCKIGVSISTDLIEENEFIIKELYGCDFTTRPEFDTPIIEMNFSEAPKLESNNTPNFQFNVSTGEGEQVLLGHDFSEQNLVEKEDFSEITNKGEFNVREYLRERARRPSIVLKMRILEEIRWIRTAREKSVKENRTFLRRYIMEYINEWISMALARPNDDLNISMGLRLMEFCKDRAPARDLQRMLRRAREQIKTSGAMTRDIQTNLNSAFVKLLGQIYDYINQKVNQKGKEI